MPFDRRRGGSQMMMRSGAFGFLARDVFTPSLAAGSVDESNSYPGPGQRNVVDTGSKISIENGVLTFAAGASAWNDPRFEIDDPQIARVAGQMVGMTVSPVATTTSFGAGVRQQASGNFNGYMFTTSARIFGILQGSLGGTTLLLGTYGVGDYTLVQVLRASGSLLLIKGGDFADWTLLYPSVTGTQSDLRMAMESFNAVVTSDDWLAPETLYIPAVLASDSFNRANGALGGSNTDGAGHAEADSGSGLTWVAHEGNFNIINTVEASPTALGTGGAFATVDTAEPDVVIEVKIETTGSPVGVVLRWVDNANYIHAYHNGTNAVLRKVVAGVGTSVVSVAATYAADARMVVVLDGSHGRLYYADVYIGAGTIADAALQTSGRHGLYANGTGSVLRLEDFVVRPRKGYSTLETFFG